MATVSNKESLQKFEEDVKSLLDSTKEVSQFVVALQPILQDLLNEPGLLPEEFQKPQPHKYGQYLLHKSEDDSFTVVAFVWGPGQKTPVHDHLTWGVIGVLQGEIEETRYRRLGGGEVQDWSVPEASKVVRAVKGNTSFVYPPDFDFHQVSNSTDEIAITIHVYGADIGTYERHVYEVESGLIKPFLGVHDNVN